MDQGGSIKIAYMEVAGGAPLVRRPGGRATQGAVAESSQIFPEFVQAQTVVSIMSAFLDKLLNYNYIHLFACRLRATCGLG